MLKIDQFLIDRQKKVSWSTCIISVQNTQNVKTYDLSYKPRGQREEQEVLRQVQESHQSDPRKQTQKKGINTRKHVI